MRNNYEPVFKANDDFLFLEESGFRIEIESYFNKTFQIFKGAFQLLCIFGLIATISVWAFIKVFNLTFSLPFWYYLDSKIFSLLSVVFLAAKIVPALWFLPFVQKLKNGEYIPSSQLWTPPSNIMDLAFLLLVHSFAIIFTSGLYYIPALVLITFTGLAYPLMLFNQYRFSEAVKISFKIAIKNPTEIFKFFFWMFLLYMLGSVISMIGFIIAYPIMNILFYQFYVDIHAQNNNRGFYTGEPEAYIQIS